MDRALHDKHIGLGVCGSIAAYKALLLARQLRQRGAHVWPVLTAAAQRFVTPLSLATLAGEAPLVDLWQPGAHGEVGHVELAHRLDALVVAPASATCLGRLARGEASDALGALALACRAPLLLAPAMETNMWEHPATQAHVRLLRERGARLLLPGSGPLASGRDGCGRMAEPEAIVAAVQALCSPQDLAGACVLITAGATREPFDPARFVSNAASGRMGQALAAAALRRGAQVRLVQGHTAAPAPPGVALTQVSSTAEMLAACTAALPGCDVVIMAAAPADWRPAQPRPDKLKKGSEAGPLEVTLEPTEDILTALGALPGERLMVGFAAETDALVPNAAAKLQRKRLDMIFANPIGVPHAGFESPTNHGWLLRRGVPPLALAPATKEALAELLLDHVVAARQAAAAP